MQQLTTFLDKTKLYEHGLKAIPILQEIISNKETMTPDGFRERYKNMCQGAVQERGNYLIWLYANRYTEEIEQLKSKYKELIKEIRKTKKQARIKRILDEIETTEIVAEQEYGPGVSVKILRICEIVGVQYIDQNDQNNNEKMYYISLGIPLFSKKSEKTEFKKTMYFLVDREGLSEICKKYNFYERI